MEVGGNGDAPIPIGNPKAGLVGWLSPEELEELKSRAYKSDELIRQLKHIVKAQHGKIEELRESVETPNEAMREMLSSKEKRDLEDAQTENADLRRQVHQLQAQLAKARKDADTLRKANRRHKAMLEAHEDKHSIDMSPEGHLLSSQLLTDSVVKGNFLPQLDFTDGLMASSMEEVLNVDRSSSRAPSTRKTQPGKMATSLAATPAPLPAFSKLSRLLSVMPVFWRDVASPIGVLRSLVQVAGRLVLERQASTVTLYLLDPWLRQASLEIDNGPPTTYYLGQGKALLQVFQHNSARPEPPRFSDLQALPVKNPSLLVVAVVAPGSQRRLAVLQASAPEEVRDRRNRVTPPAILREAMGAASSVPGNAHDATQASLGGGTPETLGYSDAQLLSWQLVGQLAGGLLEQFERIEQEHAVLERMRGFIEVVVAVSHATSLSDFEQRVKHWLGGFFKVTMVRVLFWSQETQQLIVSASQSSQLRRKECVEIPIDRGVVGRCAKRRAAMHVSNVSSHPYVDAVADGLRRSGQQAAMSDAAMLCGPMLLEDGAPDSSLLGVVQLLQRAKHSTTDSSAPVSRDFSTEEQGLFQHIVRVCAYAAWRTIRIQQLEAQLAGDTATVATMLSG